MQQYKLLRNNKEIGPLSYQELIDLPLKAYDLVWVDGKTMSWKYPSELDELKAFAPPVLDDLYKQFHIPAAIAAGTSQREVLSTRGEKKLQPKYVSVILPMVVQPKPAPVLAIETIPPISAANADQVQVENRIAYSTAAPSRTAGRYYVAGGLLLFLIAAIYFGTSENTGFEKFFTSGPHEAAQVVYREPEAGHTTTYISPLEFAVMNRNLSVNDAHYAVGIFGGISNLQLTVTNSGKSAFRDIVLSIDYIGKDKSILRTEKTAIPYLPAGASRIIQGASSPVGIAIQTRVVSINGSSPR